MLRKEATHWQTFNQYWDKGLLGQAAVFGLRTDLGLTQGKSFSWVSVIFYFGHIVGMYAASLLAQRFRHFSLTQPSNWRRGFHSCFGLRISRQTPEQLSILHHLAILSCRNSGMLITVRCLHLISCLSGNTNTYSSWKVENKGAKIFGFYLPNFFSAVWVQYIGLGTSNADGYTKKAVYAAGTFIGYSLGNVTDSLFFDQKNYSSRCTMLV